MALAASHSSPHTLPPISPICSTRAGLFTCFSLSLGKSLTEKTKVGLQVWLLTLSSTCLHWEGLGVSRTALPRWAGAEVPGQTFSISHFPDPRKVPSFLIPVSLWAASGYTNKALATICSSKDLNSPATLESTDCHFHPALLLALCIAMHILGRLRRQESEVGMVTIIPSHKEGLLPLIWEGTPNKLLHSTRVPACLS